MSANPEEPILFTCELCGRQFEPTPDAMVEWEAGIVAIDEREAKDQLSVKELAIADADDLEGLGLTEEQRDAVLRGEVVKTGGCVCLPCQDQMLEAPED